MIQLLRKLSSDELQELVDLVAGCTCSNVTSKTETETETENLVQTELQDYYDIIIFNFETINKTIKEYKDDTEEYLLEREQEFAEALSELKAMQDLESIGFEIEKQAIDKLNKKIGDLVDIIKQKSEGIKKKPTPTPTSSAPTTPPTRPTPTTPPRTSTPVPTGGVSATKVGAAIAITGGVATIGGTQYKVSSEFGRRKSPKKGASSDHRGMDIAMPIGSKVPAIASGQVIIAGDRGKAGNVVYIRHDDGSESRYFHLNEIYVKAGDRIESGVFIGEAGATGNVTGAHLHLETLENGKQVNPREFILKRATGATGDNSLIKRKDYYNNVYNALHKEAKKAGIKNPEVIATLGASQSSLETGFGKKVAGKHNYFGIKAQRGEAGTAQATKEFDPRSGTTINTTGKFKNYKDFDESAADYIKFLQTNPRYKNVLESKTVEKAIAEQGKTGYASAPDYAEKLLSISRGMSTIPEKKASTSQVASAQPELIRRISKQNTKTIIQPIIIQK